MEISNTARGREIFFKSKVGSGIAQQCIIRSESHRDCVCLTKCQLRVIHSIKINSIVPLIRIDQDAARGVETGDDVVCGVQDGDVHSIVRDELRSSVIRDREPDGKGAAVGKVVWIGG